MIREALADYIASEGCSCCRNTEAHEDAARRLGKLLPTRTAPVTTSTSTVLLSTNLRVTIHDHDS